MASERSSSGKAHQQGRSLLRFEVGENQGNGLGMLAFDEFGQLLRVGLLERVELAGRRLGCDRYLPQQFLGSFFAEGFDQQFVRRSLCLRA